MTESLNIDILLKIFKHHAYPGKEFYLTPWIKDTLIFASEIWAKKIKIAGRYYFFVL